METYGVLNEMARPGGGEGRRRGVRVDGAKEEGDDAPGGSAGVRDEEGELEMHGSEAEVRDTVAVVEPH